MSIPRLEVMAVLVGVRSLLFVNIWIERRDWDWTKLSVDWFSVCSQVDFYKETIQCVCEK